MAVQPDGATFVQLCGYADVPDSTKPGELNVHFPFAPTGDYWQYWVLDTDYDNYTSVYSCRDIPRIGKFEFTWILVRNPEKLTSEIKDRALETFISRGIEINSFVETSQENCAYEDPSGAPLCTSE